MLRLTPLGLVVSIALAAQFTPRIAHAGPTDFSTLAGARGEGPGGPPPGGALQTDPFTGAASYTLAIQVPAAPASFEPQLALSYSSRNRADSWVGYGWSLGTSSIARSLRHGVPSYDDSQDLFTLDGQELVEVGFDNEAGVLRTAYRTRQESFVRIVHEVGPGIDSWTLSRKDGTRLRYGATPESRIERPTGGIFEWLVTQQMDRNDNAMEYRYDATLDGGAAYPSEVRYGLRAAGAGVESLGGNAEADRVVRFVLEPAERADTSSNHAAGLRRELRRRLDRIDVGVGSGAAFQLLRRYDLVYRESPDSFRSLLDRVAVYGFDADEPSPTPPWVTRFAYSSNVEADTTGWEPIAWSWPTGGFAFVDDAGHDAGVRLGDADGDGRVDLVKAFSTNALDGSPAALSADSGVYLNTGVAFSAERAQSFHPLPSVSSSVPGAADVPMAFASAFPSIGGLVWGNGATPLDLTGDGRMDVVGAVGFAFRDPAESPLEQAFQVPWCWSTGTHFECLADFENDYYRDGTLYTAKQVLMPLGGPPTFGYLAGNTQFADLDGDGLPELVVRGRDTSWTTGGPPCVAGHSFSYVVFNLGGLRFERAPLAVGPAQDLGCGTEQPLLSRDFQPCDLSSDPSCRRLLFHSETQLALFCDIHSLPFCFYWGAFGHRDLGNRALDLDSDGLADALSATLDADTGELAASAWLNDGSGGFRAAGAWALPADAALRETRRDAAYPASDAATSTDRGVRLADVNGDGRLDVLRAREGDPRQAWLGDGDEAQAGDPTPWVASTAWRLPAGLEFVDDQGRDRGVRLVDLDGDGMVDVLRSAGSVRSAYGNRGSVPDLLVHVASPLGATRTLTYLPSTAFEHVGDDGVPDLPQVLQLVAAIEVDDGRGNLAFTSFGYEDGVFDAERRAFLGFGTVVTTRADGRRTVARYHQDDGRAGLLASEAVFDAEGAPWSTTEFEYTADEDDRPPFAHLVERIRRLEYDGHLEPRRSLTRFVYDDLGPQGWGKTTASTEFGEVDEIDGDLSPSDTRTVELVYAPVNELRSLADRVAIRRLREGSTPGSGSVVRETLSFYDGDTTGLVPPVTGNLTRQVDVLGEPDEPDPTTTFAYDELGNRVSVTTPRSHAGETLDGAPLPGTSSVEHDPIHRTFPIAFVNPLGHRTELLYAASEECAVRPPAGAGLVHEERGPNDLLAGTARLRCYDAFGRPVLDRAPGDLAETRWGYDDTPGAIRITEIRRATRAGGMREVSRELDGLGRVVRTRATGPQGRGVRTELAYDPAGRLIGQTEPHFVGATPAAAAFEYDPLDRVVRTTLPGSGRIHEVTYDRGLVGHVDANGHETRRQLDTFGNVVRVEEVEASALAITRYAYDVSDQLTWIQDPGGNVTLLFYDALGRRRQVFDPDAGTLLFDYDAHGNRTRRTNAAGVVEWTYDALDRPLESMHEGTSGRRIRWRYGEAENGIGRLSRRDDEAGFRRVIAYDLLGRVLHERIKAGGHKHAFRTTYDPLGQVSARVYPTALAIERERDEAGFLREIRTSSGEVLATGIEWDAQGRLAAWDGGNGVGTRVVHDGPTARLQELRVEGAVLLEHLRYAFDPGDRLESIEDLRDPGQSRSFTYDARDRLVQATGPFAPGLTPGTSLFYAYDALGNLTCKAALALNGCQGGTRFVYPPSGPGMPNPHAPIEVDGARATHDPAGNLLQLGGRSYGHDVFGRLASAWQSGSLLARFTYDANGRLATLVDYTVSPASVRHLVTDDFEWNAIDKLARVRVRLTGRVIVTLEGTYEPSIGTRCSSSGPSGGGGSPLALWVLFAPGLAALVVVHTGTALRRRGSGTWRPVVAAGTAGTLLVAVGLQGSSPFLMSVARAGLAPSVVYHHGDHLGSSILMTDASGTVLQRTVYRPFGEVVRETVGELAAVPELGFTGQRYVASLGLYQHGARWYDPVLGRFLQPDPVVQAPANPQTLNPYSYVLNNPLGRIDPSGAFSIGDLFGGVVNAASRAWGLVGTVPVLGPTLRTLVGSGLGLAAAVTLGPVADLARLLGRIPGLGAPHAGGPDAFDRAASAIRTGGRIPAIIGGVASDRVNQSLGYTLDFLEFALVDNPGANFTAFGRLLAEGLDPFGDAQAVRSFLSDRLEDAADAATLLEARCSSQGCAKTLFGLLALRQGDPEGKMLSSVHLEAYGAAADFPEDLRAALGSFSAFSNPGDVVGRIFGPIDAEVPPFPKRSPLPGESHFFSVYFEQCGGTGSCREP